MSNLHGPWVVGISAALVSMLSLVVLLQFWQPKTTWNFEHEKPEHPDAAVAPPPRHSPRAAWVAWMPWILLSVLVFTWGLPPVKDFLNGGAKDRPNFLHGRSLFEYHVPVLDKAIARIPPVVTAPTPEPAVYVFNPLSATCLLYTSRCV